MSKRRPLPTLPRKRGRGSDRSSGGKKKPRLNRGFGPLRARGGGGICAADTLSTRDRRNRSGSANTIFRRPPLLTRPSRFRRNARRRKEIAMDTPAKPGLIVAPLTPFTSDLAVDEPALRRQIDYVVEDCGTTMVVAAGVETQEYTYLSLEQRKALIRATVEAVGGRVPVMVGISHPSFRTAVELAHEAERLGAAAVQLLAPLRPFAGPPTQADLIAYFEAIGRE